MPVPRARDVEVTKESIAKAKYWKAAEDKQTGKRYYYHRVTREVRWYKPLGYEEAQEERRIEKAVWKSVTAAAAAAANSECENVNPQLVQQVQVIKNGNGNGNNIEMETKSDNGNGNQESVRYVSNATQLFEYLQQRQWASALDHLRKQPADAKVYIMQPPSSNGKAPWKVLPLHASIILGAPYQLIVELINAYPDSVRRRDLNGSLPAHLAAAALGSYSNNSEKLFTQLMISYPEAKYAVDKNGHTPLKLLHHTKLMQDKKVEERRQRIMEMMSMDEQNKLNPHCLLRENAMNHSRQQHQPPLALLNPYSLSGKSTSSMPTKMPSQIQEETPLAAVSDLSSQTSDTGSFVSLHLGKQGTVSGISSRTDLTTSWSDNVRLNKDESRDTSSLLNEAYESLEHKEHNVQPPPMEKEADPAATASILKEIDIGVKETIGDIADDESSMIKKQSARAKSYFKSKFAIFTLVDNKSKPIPSSKLQSEDEMNENINGGRIIQSNSIDDWYSAAKMDDKMQQPSQTKNIKQLGLERGRSELVKRSEPMRNDTERKGHHAGNHEPAPAQREEEEREDECEWASAYDEMTNKKYYYHKETKDLSWSVPLAVQNNNAQQVVKGGSTTPAKADTKPHGWQQMSLTDHSTLDNIDCPTPIFLYLHQGDWAEALNRINQFPDEASIYIWKKLRGYLLWRLLPLHASIVLSAPSYLVLEIMNAYPLACRTRDMNGDLPIHLAASTIDSHPQGERIFNHLMRAFPDSIGIEDGNGRTSIEIAKLNGKTIDTEDFLIEPEEDFLFGQAQESRDEADNVDSAAKKGGDKDDYVIETGYTTFDDSEVIQQNVARGWCSPSSLKSGFFRVRFKD